MYKILTFIVSMVVLTVGGTLVYRSSAVPVVQPVQAEAQKPWVEVLSPQAFLLETRDSITGKELKTGDELEQGAIVETGEKGRANIYFPDGSVARLDVSTKLVVTEGTFDEKNNTLRVQMKLFVGRVWSKVVGLATPDSLWEVKSTNAVVTVRGTAFGMEYKNGKSRVVGSEHTVKVSAVDPKTDKVLPNTEAEVKEHTFVAVEDKNLLKLQSRASAMAEAVKQAPDNVFEEAWVKDAVEADKVFNKKFDELKAKHLEEKELRQEFRTEIKAGFVEKIKERRVETQRVNMLKQKTNNAGVDDKKGAADISPVEKKVEKSISMPKQDEAGGDTGGGVSPSAGGDALRSATTQSSERLEIGTVAPLSGVVEGKRITFHATLFLDDGSTRDVTKEVEWRTVGQIGGFSSPGVFEPQLAPAVSELGEATGAVVGTWRNKNTGSAVIGKTQLFKVDAAPDTSTIRED